MREPPFDAVTLTDGAVTLRPFRPDDAEAVAAAMEDGEIARWTGTIPWPYGRGDAERWIGTHEFRRYFGDGFDLAVTAVGSDGALGAIGIDVKSDGAGQVGYWIAAGHRGRGYARRALALLRDHAIGVLRIDHLRLLTIEGNVASERVAAAAGFAPVEVLAVYDLGGGRREPVTRWMYPPPAPAGQSTRSPTAS